MTCGRLACDGCALVCFSFCVREIDGRRRSKMSCSPASARWLDSVNDPSRRRCGLRRGALGRLGREINSVETLRCRLIVFAVRSMTGDRRRQDRMKDTHFKKQAHMHATPLRKMRDGTRFNCIRQFYRARKIDARIVLWSFIEEHVR